MVGEFAMNHHDLFRFSKPQECSVCKRSFLTPRELVTHFESVHSGNPGLTTFGSPVTAPAATLPPNYRVYPTQNRNPNPGFAARNQFDMNYYRRGYLDEQGRFHRGPPPVSRSNFLFVQNKRPRLMEYLPGLESDGGRTMPLLGQLEQPRVEETVWESSGDVSGPLDLSLRL